MFEIINNTDKKIEEVDYLEEYITLEELITNYRSKEILIKKK